MSLICSNYLCIFLLIVSKLVFMLVQLFPKDTLLWYSCCICDLYVSSDVLQELESCSSNDLQHVSFIGRHL